MTSLRPTAFLTGVLGGVAGLAAMRLYWRAASALTGDDPRGRTSDDPPHQLDDLALAGEHRREGEASTEAVGRMAYSSVTGEQPDDETKSSLSMAVHRGYGAVVGGLYGLIRGRTSPPDAAGGAAFGTALWLLGDELAVPMLGLSKGPTAYPPSQHAHRLGAHLAFGLAASATTQAANALVARAPSSAGQTLFRAGRAYLTWKIYKRGIGKLLRLY